MIACIDGKGYKSWQEALKSAENKNWVWGAHSYECPHCSMYHAKANIARDWAKQPLGSKRGPKVGQPATNDLPDD